MRPDGIIAGVKRALKKRSPVVVAPLLVSQLNCEPLCGIDARRFLELLPRLDISVAMVGKLRLVDAEEFRACLAAQSAPSVPADLARQPESVDEALALIGRRLTR
jgi:hypothetical protein